MSRAVRSLVRGDPHTHTFSCCSYYVQRGTVYRDYVLYYFYLFTVITTLASMYNVFIL